MSELFFDHVTPNAILPRQSLTKDEGRDPRNWTPHVYERSETRMTGVGMAIVHMFRCTVTKQLRVWGFE